MRIGFSTSVVQRGKTGVAEYVFSLLRTLGSCAADHHFVLYVLDRDLPLFRFVRPHMELVPVPERYRNPVSNILWHQAVLPRLARIHRLDVVHVPSYRRMMWSAPCPRVSTVHDLAAFHVPGKYDWKRMFYARHIAGKVADRQEALIAVSENTAEDMARFWKIPRWRITVIHHGMDLQRFTPKEAPAARAFCEHRFGLQQPFFLYVARLEHPGKNHVRLIQAFERFKDETRLPWQLVLAGNDWHGADAIHAAIAGSPARDDIRCLGFVAKKELPLLYRAAGMFVYPSLFEGFGLPVLEAMASGCPVLCSTRGALGEVVGNAAATADPEDIDALKNQMAVLARSEALRKGLRTAGLAWSKRFDWNKAAEQTLAVYRRVVARTGEHRAEVPILSAAAKMARHLPITFPHNLCSRRPLRRQTFFDTTLES